MVHLTRQQPRPIGYDIQPDDNGGWVAYLVCEGDQPGPRFPIERGRSKRRVQRRAAHHVVRELHNWEHRNGSPRTRVILVPPTVGPRGPAGASR